MSGVETLYLVFLFVCLLLSTFFSSSAGFVLNLLGHIPKTGERLRYKGMTLAITEMRGVKIEKILLTKKKHAASAG